MTEEDPRLFESPAPEPVDEWGPYEDILSTEEGAVPVYGIQVLVFMDTNGRQHTRWSIEGDPDPDMLIGTIERVQFFTHLNALEPGLMIVDEEPPDGEDPDE